MMHYNRLRATGSVGPGSSIRMPRDGSCANEGCDLTVQARGLCRLHYERAHRDRSVPAHERLYAKRTSDVCVVDGCDKASTASKGMCPMHYYRQRVHGHHGPAEPSRRAKGSGTEHNGYRLKPCPPRWASMATKQGLAMEHRIVMADKLGRALTRAETVHHKDGDRLNNSPDNLELWVGNHGSGQKLEDALAAARALLAAHGLA